MPWGATQDGCVIVRVPTKRGPLEKGPLQYSCLENSMNSMKKQKDVSLKDELPRFVGLEKSGEIAPGRMKRLSQSKKNTHLWM